MATVVKTLRIDEDFVKLIDEYVKISKDLMGVAPTVNNVISGAVIEGFDKNLDVFRILLTATFVNSDDSAKFTDELKARIKSLIQRYEEYQFEFETKED